MSDEKDNKLKGIKETRKSTQIDRTKEISNVGKVDKVKQVKSVSSVGNIRKADPASAITKAKLKSLYAMIDQEADKLFSNAENDEEKREIVKNAVKMVLESAAEDDE